MQTERVTRSRARTLAAAGETPLVAALPEKTPATRAAGRRRAAAAATAPPAAAPTQVPSEHVQPVVLFDVTNDPDSFVPAATELAAEPAPTASGEQPAAETAIVPEVAAPEELTAQPEAAGKNAAASAEMAAPTDPALAAASPVPTASPAPAVQLAAEPAPAAESSAEGSRPASPARAAEEPPATPASLPPASPAPPLPSATPTGLGLSNLPPLSPMVATMLPASTPAATPVSGLAANDGCVSHALHAAVQALGGAPASPATALSPTAPATANANASPDTGLSFRGFGSPLKQETVSPEGMAVSIAGAIGAASPLRCGPSPGFGGTDEDVDATSASPAGRSPTMQPTAATPVVAPRSAVQVRTVARAHPLTPSRQFVLEEDQEDYIMQVRQEEGQGQEPEADEAPAEEEDEDRDMGAEPSPAPERPAEQAKPRLQSKVAVPSPFDPRSLRQLRREVADRLASKQAAAPTGLDSEGEEEEEEEYIGTAAAGSEELLGALGALSLETGVHHGLRGLPTPAGKHIRFDDDGEAAGESPRQRVFLRGLPAPAGSHMRFDD
ncbi:hypothetical protein ABPG77_005847 [Micractinium sp. CCAP 211/92]